ncbi:MFS transporter [Sphingopyxis sp.]|uniref:spinster family MFS transporter n=1 Tax=Sphingopyxis sp. TaxID=1908224 RepID=UPI001DE5B951|nr:MFS transporter [Sphingopyxis sp.]MBW8296364.1 MFS transporter [Sphingopyxis sp.]
MTLRPPRLAFLLAVLTLANAVNYMDRSLIFVLGEPIKRDLGLSDVELGLLHGLAFALVFSFLGLPLSRIADRGRQRLVIIGSIALWSVMTTLGGFAQSFAQLAAMRVGVAAGEAGLHPASHSLISRLFPDERRGRALAIFSIGIPAGLAAGSVLGGWIADQWGWRWAFLVMGPVSLILLPLAYLALPASKAPVETRTASLIDAMWTMWRIPEFRWVWLGYAVATAFGYGSGTFFVPFYMREHGLSALEAGGLYGIINGVIGVIGILAGGWLFDIGGRRGRGHALTPTILALIASGLLAPLGWMMPTLVPSVVLVTTALLLYIFVSVPTIAITQAVAPPEMRATASALIGLSGGLVGAITGPLAVGALSDLFGGGMAAGALPQALALVALVQLVAAALYWRARFHLRSAPAADARSVAAPT